MLAINYIKNLSVDKLNYLVIDQEDIINEEVIAVLEKMAADSMFDSEPGKANELYSKLTKAYEQYQEDLKQHPGLHSRYIALLTNILWKAFPAIPRNFHPKILETKVIYSFNRKIDVKSYIKRYLNLFEDNFRPDEEERRKMLYAVTNNEERIGNQPINLKTQDKAPPIVKNWLRDFVSYLSKNFAGGKFEQISYLNSNQNVAKLSQQDKETLSKVIELYAWLKTPPVLEIVKEDTEKKPIVEMKKPQVPEPTAGSRNFKPAPPPPQPNELRRELETPELPEHKQQTEAESPKPMNLEQFIKSQQTVRHSEAERIGIEKLPVAPRQPNSREEIATSSATGVGTPRKDEVRVRGALKSLNDIKVIEDLKKVEVGHLRQAPLPTQISNLKSHISRLAQVNHLLPYHVVSVFEQSPLFKQYLFLGGSLVADRRADRKLAFNEAVARLKASGQQAMSLTEFEALADLRREIDRM
ncbi:MAG: hypothetical protein HYW51_01300 [Candidatus Doudnabacteria bacterium]|nr:hypothetical protein [Candidatus Doudnabacteria bacterium]